MRKIIFTIIAVIYCTINCIAQDKTIVREGNSFSFAKVAKEEKKDEKTEFTWNKKGVEYPIYISSKGSCYILVKDTTTGEDKKQYLGSEVSAEVCKILGREYTAKKN